MRRARALVALGVVAALATAGAAQAGERPRGDVRVFARVPAPGYPALSLVTPGGTVYVGTFMDAGETTTGPSKVFAYSTTGRLLRTYTVRGQTPGAAHGVQVAERDRHGRLYLLDQAPPRVLVLDPRTGRQTTYATFADVPTCTDANAPADCSNTVTDNPPEPDYAAWLPDGSLLVTDYAQQLVWRVPPGGGKARVWLNDLRLDGEDFGPAGIVLLPSHRSVLLTVSAGGLLTSGGTDDLTTGKLYLVGIDSAGRPTRLRQLWASGPAQAPDGFAVSRTGHVYVALSGPTGNVLAELAPDARGHWGKVWQVPADPVDAAGQPVPWDTPTSVAFLGDRVLVTNTAYFTGDPSHWVLFGVAVHDRAAPHFVP